ncbi:hypothetical protein DF185_13385 [Marinifilum breve]|uniref:4Fe-4S ferredoxin-type domain-containing protein n=1 Tax=Marinifilum breve TaxID=2184082 RepID=A0A2V3ZW42_9BACT|nr:4Fe-4S binding protein [Marinifilum breve]PXY00885.1 hypothetical protein DF185_13385 [Marinifilum breve]
MKRIKKNTNFTFKRDLVRAIAALSFYALVLIPHILGYEGFEYESEYIVLGSILLLGPWFCGWACPFGNASYFMTRLGAKLFPSLQFQIQPKIHNILKYCKYLLLVYFLSLFAIKGIDYFGDHMVMYQSNWFTSMYIKFKHIAVLFIPLFLPRFFCKYLCFQKGAYNLLNLIFPSSSIIRDSSTCINCKKCDRVCPMQIRISKKESIMGDECLNCFNCLDQDVCPPKHRSLKLQVWGKIRMPLQFGLLMFFVYILISLVVKLISGA